jgi:hypothetical protein
MSPLYRTTSIAFYSFHLLFVVQLLSASASSLPKNQSHSGYFYMIRIHNHIECIYRYLLTIFSLEFYKVPSTDKLLRIFYFHLPFFLGNNFLSFAMNFGGYVMHFDWLNKEELAGDYIVMVKIA